MQRSASSSRRLPPAAGARHRARASFQHFRPRCLASCSWHSCVRGVVEGALAPHAACDPEHPRYPPPTQNAIRDSGLMPQFTDPDYGASRIEGVLLSCDPTVACRCCVRITCLGRSALTLLTPCAVLCWGYPPGSIFASHYDSRYNWGEVRCGAPHFLRPRSAPVLKRALPPPLHSTWRACRWGRRARSRSSRTARASAYPPRARVKCASSCRECNCMGWGSLRAERPHPPAPYSLRRRSIYVMTGDSRWAWQHGLSRIGNNDYSKVKEDPPAWNPLGWRRSWTFRSTKVFQIETLRAQALRVPSGSAERMALNARIAAQMVTSKVRLSSGGVGGGVILPLRGPHLIFPFVFARRWGATGRLRSPTTRAW